MWSPKNYFVLVVLFSLVLTKVFIFDLEYNVAKFKINSLSSYYEKLFTNNEKWISGKELKRPNSSAQSRSIDIVTNLVQKEVVINIINKTITKDHSMANTITFNSVETNTRLNNSKNESENLIDLTRTYNNSVSNSTQIKSINYVQSIKSNNDNINLSNNQTIIGKPTELNVINNSTFRFKLNQTFVSHNMSNVSETNEDINMQGSKLTTVRTIFLKSDEMNQTDSSKNLNVKVGTMKYIKNLQETTKGKNNPKSNSQTNLSKLLLNSMQNSKPNKIKQILNHHKISQNNEKTDKLKKNSLIVGRLWHNNVRSTKLKRLETMASTLRDDKKLMESGIKDLAKKLQLEKTQENVGQFWSLRSRHKIKMHSTEVTYPKDVKNILIVASWRSGSTFLGELINTHPGTFYSFEPLHFLSSDVLIPKLDNVTGLTSEGSRELSDAEELLKSLFRCNFGTSLLQKYLMHTYKNKNTFLLRHNFRVWNLCVSGFGSVCFHYKFLNSICPLFPIKLIKLVRLNMKYIENLIQDPEIGPNLKVIHLVRDPRGLMYSRSMVDWCYDMSCKDPSSVCQDLDRSLEAGLELKQKYPNKIYLVRYEDLAMNPFEETENIFKFLKLDFKESVKNFLKGHTTHTYLPNRENLQNLMGRSSYFLKRIQSRYKSPYSTIRDSKTTAVGWRSKMVPLHLDLVQQACAKQMKILGYNLFNTKEEQYDNSFPVLLNISEQLKPLRTM